MKELQGLSRVLDTLVYAYEFITLPTPSEQAEGLEALRRTVLRLHPDLKVRCSIMVWWNKVHKAWQSPATAIGPEYCIPGNPLYKGHAVTDGR